MKMSSELYLPHTGPPRFEDSRQVISFPKASNKAVT